MDNRQSSGSHPLAGGNVVVEPTGPTALTRPIASTVSEETVARIKRQIQASQTSAAQSASHIPPAVLQATKFPKLGGMTTGVGSETLAELLKMIQEGPQPLVDAKVADYYRRTLPSALGSGMDLRMIVDERERIMDNLAIERIVQLEKILESDASLLDTLTKNRIIIEIKSLKLRHFQREMREKILRLYSKFEDPANFNNRASLRLGKRQTMKTSRSDASQGGTSSSLKKKVTSGTTGTTSNKEREATGSTKLILAHYKELQAKWRTQSQRRARLVKQVMHHHSNFEREENKKSERVMKERMKALKNNDEAAYYKLLDQEKDVRLTFLLKQTDEFLINLTEKVKAHQEVTEQRLIAENVFRGDKKVIVEGGVGAGVVAEVVGGVEAITEDEAISDFYKKIHRSEVQVTEQPKMLIGGQLKDYQMKGLQWMVSLYENRLNGILADEMGLGKTIQTIALVSYLIETLKLTGPFLIIVPLSTMTNWSMEFEKWAPQVQRIEYKGVPAQRKLLQQQIKHGQFNVLLTTYEYVIKDRTALSKAKWLYLIVDEGHRMKNSRSKLATALTQHYSMRYRLILTGTPLQNNLPELWSLLNFLLPEVFNSCKTFEEWFNTPFANTGETMELNEEELLLVIRRLHKVLHPFLLRRMKKDVESELPDKVEIVLKCPMSALQSTLYRAITSKNTSVVMKDSKNLGIRRLNNTIMQLRKICNHPFVFDEVEQQLNPRHINNDLLYRVSGKFELLQRILPKFAAADHKVLMFFQMTQIMTIMEDFLTMQGYKYLRLDGSTKAEDRTELLKKFNAPNAPYFIFLLSTRAGGLGLNLQTADTVVIFDSDWNPHQDLQAQDRAHRIGQTKEVRIFRLITVESVEEYILKRAQHKLSLDGKIIQAGKFDQRSTNEERDEMLRAILEREAEADDVNEIYDDEELNDIVARNDAELEHFKELDQQRLVLDKERFERTGVKVSRLMETSELPNIYMSVVEETVADDAFETASDDLSLRSARRRDVSYNENISDSKWLAQLEREADTTTPIPTLSTPISNTANTFGSKQARKRRNDNIECSSDAESSTMVSEDSPAKLPKLRFKVPIRPAKTTAIDDDNTFIEKDDKYLDDDVRERIIQDIFNLLENCTDLGTGRYRSDLFLELPDPLTYPDYYSLIKRPISLAEIEKKMKEAHYSKSICQFLSDIDLMCENAMKYNVEGSQVYEDAQVIKQLAHDKYDELLEAEGSFDKTDGEEGNSEEEDEDDNEEDDDNVDEENDDEEDDE